MQNNIILAFINKMPDFGIIYNHIGNERNHSEASLIY